MSRRKPTYELVALAFTRLGMSTRTFTSPQVRVAGRLLSSSRAVAEGLPWLHVAGSNIVNPSKVMKDASLVAALTDRIPAVGVVNETTGDLRFVQLPGWAFVALLRMVATCNQTTVNQVLNDFLPLGTSLSPADRKMGSGILSSLAELEQSSSST